MITNGMCVNVGHCTNSQALESHGTSHFYFLFHIVFFFFTWHLVYIIAPDKDLTSQSQDVTKSNLVLSEVETEWS